MDCTHVLGAVQVCLVSGEDSVYSSEYGYGQHSGAAEAVEREDTACCHHGIHDGGYCEVQRKRRQREDVKCLPSSDGVRDSCPAQSAPCRTSARSEE